jgi:glycosyltransferase involved in cell wall biosynthesis
MKILFASHGLPSRQLGGGEIYTYTVAKAMLQRGWDVLCFSRDVDHSFSPYYIKNENIENLKIKRLVNNFTDIKDWRSNYLRPKVKEIFSDILIEFKPDIVHFQHLYSLSADLPEITKNKNIPSVLTIHDFWYFCHRVNLFKADFSLCDGPDNGKNCARCIDEWDFFPVNPVNDTVLKARESSLRFFIPYMPQCLINVIKKVSQKTIVKKDIDPFEIKKQYVLERNGVMKTQLENCDRILCPSKFHTNKYHQETNVKKIEFLPLGIEYLPKIQRKKINSGVLKLGFFGNITPTKGLDVVIKALQILDKWSRVEFHIFGQPYNKDYLKNSLINNNEKIVFHGRYERNKESMLEILGSIDIVIFPSRWHENSPLVVRESLMTGTPIISTKLGGAPEVVIDNLNGLLFDPAKPEELANCVRRVLDETGLLEKLTLGAFETKIIDIDSHIDNGLLPIYKNLLMKKNK